MSPFYVLVEISLVFELAATLNERAVFGQLRHVVHQRIQEAAELRDLDELFLGGHFHYSIEVIAQALRQLVKPFYEAFGPILTCVWHLL